eukprot:253079-Pelagomonas_calceolata.AAC.2
MGKTLNAQRSQGETLYAHRSGSQGKQQGSSPHTPAVQGGAREPSTSRCVLSQPAVALPAAWRWRVCPQDPYLRGQGKHAASNSSLRQRGAHHGAQNRPHKH